MCRSSQFSFELEQIAFSVILSDRAGLPRLTLCYLETMVLSVNLIFCYQIRLPETWSFFFSSTYHLRRSQWVDLRNFQVFFKKMFLIKDVKQEFRGHIV